MSRYKMRILYPNDVYTAGEYVVGRHIPSGEYFLWGSDICYYVKRNNSYFYKGENEGYDYFEDGDCICIERGYFTQTNNTSIDYGNFDEQKLLDDANIRDDYFYNYGIRIPCKRAIDVVVYERNTQYGCICGEIPVDVKSYVIYSVDKRLKWRANIIPRSFQYPKSFIFKFTDLSDEFNSYNIKHIGFSVQKNRSERDLIQVTVGLPSRLIGIKLKIELLGFNGTNVSGMLEYNTKEVYFKKILNQYHNDYIEYIRLIRRFEGFVDFGVELEYVEKAPDLIKHINECLKEILKLWDDIRRRNYSGKEVGFNVSASYDKKYYCCVKLVDNAIRVDGDSDLGYEVFFDDSQVEEIEIMYYLFRFALDNKEKIEAYLDKYSNVYAAINCAQRKINVLRDEYGYSSVVTHSVLVNIQKTMHKQLQRRVDEIYNEICLGGQVQVKWANEYKLFKIISKYVSSVKYQYKCEWLGMQSYDIYLEDFKIAIEYQGKQHYDAIDHFGGEEALLNTQARDERKRKLSIENGVRLLEWKYTVNVTDDNVTEFLRINDIPIEHVNRNNDYREYVGNRMSLELPRKVRKESVKPKVPKERVSRVKIVRYSLDGMLDKEYNTVKEASEDVGISGTSISKVLKGNRKTSGGYIWRRYDISECIPDKIEL